MKIDGRLLQIEDFRQHVNSLPNRDIRAVCIHHTANPDEECWRQYGGWQHFKFSMKQTYEAMEWSAGPHLYVSYEGIGLFTPLTEDGVGAYGFNDNVWHIETVGNFEIYEPPPGLFDTLCHVVAALMGKAELDPMNTASLTFHKAVNNTQCPGRHLIEKFQTLRERTVSYMSAPAWLPENEQGDLKTLIQKALWWSEELQRMVEREHSATEQREAIQLSYLKLMNRIVSML